MLKKLIIYCVCYSLVPWIIRNTIAKIHKSGTSSLKIVIFSISNLYEIKIKFMNVRAKTK